MELGRRIRILRTQLDLTLEDLARRTGVSRTMLSDIERGVRNPTIKVVCQIAEGLNCTVSQLLGEQPSESETILLIRQNERQVLLDPQTGIERHHLCPAFLRRGLEVVLYIIPPRQIGSFPPHHSGVVEHITIIRGQVKCRLNQWEETLMEGDSLYFHANITHDFYNPGPEPCHFFFLKDSGQVEHSLTD